MRKNAIVVLTFVLMAAIVVVDGCSKGYEAKKAVDDLSVTLKADRYPLIKGDNDLSVSVADATGKTLTDTTVQVRYYMPVMPGMAPMEFNTRAVPKGDVYAFTANPPMEGGWRVEVAVTRQGKPTVTTTFNVDAR